MAYKPAAILLCFAILNSVANTPRFSLEVPVPSDTPLFSDLSGARFQKDTGNIILSSNGQTLLWEEGSTAPRPVDLPLLDKKGFGVGSMQCASGVEVQVYCGVIYAGGKTYELGSFALGTQVGDFNSLGDFVGITPSGSFPEPILWREGKIYRLNELVNGTGRFHAPVVINEAGVIYGIRYITGTGTTAMVVRLTPDGNGRYDLTDLYEFKHTAVTISKNGLVATMGMYWSIETGPTLLTLGVEDWA